MKPPPAQKRGGGGHHEDIWNETSTLALLEAWGSKMPRQRHHRRGYGPLSRVDWSHITQQVLLSGTPFKSETQCRNRIDTLKKKYKREKRKQEASATSVGDGSSSSWIFFEKMDELLNNMKYDGAQETCPSNGGSDDHDDDVVNNDAKLLDRMPNDSRRTCPGYGDDDGVKDAEGDGKMSDRTQKHSKKTGLSYGADDVLKNVNDGNASKNANGKHGHGRAKPFKVHNLSNFASSSCDDSEASESSSGLSGRGEHEKCGNMSKEWMRYKAPLVALGKAVEVFAEMYEKVETAKQKQALELEKTRMEITKKFELQKWRLFMQTKIELAKINGSDFDTDADMDAKLFATCFMPLDYCL